MCECLGNIYRIESCRLLRNAIRICSGASSDHQPLTAARNLPSLSLFSPCQTGTTSRHIKNRNHVTAHQTVTRGLCLSFCWRLIICCSPPAQLLEQVWTQRGGEERRLLHRRACGSGERTPCLQECPGGWRHSPARSQGPEQAPRQLLLF